MFITMKDLKEKLINESGNLENKAWDAVFDYADKEAKDVSEFLRFIMDIINEVTGANICRGDKDDDAGYLQDIVELIGDYCEKKKLLDFSEYKDNA